MNERRIYIESMMSHCEMGTGNITWRDVVLEQEKELSELREKMKEIQEQFNKMWSCLKFEKMSSKVIGYTFDKREVDKFKELLRRCER